MKKSRIILVALLVMAVTCAVAFGCGNDTQDPGEPQTYTVTVTGGTADKATAASGETVTLTVGTAPDGSEFLHWTVDGAEIEGNTFKMPAKNVTAEAVFGKINYTVTVTGGTADKTTAQLGDKITLTVGNIPEGKVFSHWTVNGTRIDGNTFTMTAANAVVEAVYTDAEYDITVTGGTADKETAKLGETVTLTAGKAPDGQQFSHWTVNGTRIDGNTFVMTAADAVVEAVYTYIDYTSSVTGGTADKATAHVGDTVKLTPNAPGANQAFSHWTVNGEAIEGNTFTMPAANVTANAVFVTSYTVMVEGGTADKTTAKEGEIITLTVGSVPQGKEFDYWTVNGDRIEGNTFEMPAENVTVNAVYADVYTISVTGGTADKETARAGVVITLTPGAAEEGKQFDHWESEDVEITDNKFTMPASDVEITAVFTYVQYKITVTGGTADKETAKLGDTVTLTVGEAPEGTAFSHWLVNGKRIEGNTFVMEAGNTEVEAVFVQSRKIDTPDNSENKLIYKEPGNSVALDRSGNTMFTDATDYVLVYIYDSPDAEEEIGTLKLVRDPEGDGTLNTAGTLSSSDGSLSVPISGQPGNYFIDANSQWDNLFKLLAHELGYNYSDGRTFYFAMQVIAKSDPVQVDDTWIKFSDSDISAIGTEGLVKNAEVPSDMYTVSVEGGKIDGEHTSVSAGYGNTLTLTAEQPEEGFLFGGWYLADEEGNPSGDALSMSLTYEYTVTGNAVIIAQYVEETAQEPIETPDNSQSALIRKAGNGAIEFDRSGNTMFTAATDHVVYYVYDSKDAQSGEYIGQFKMRVEPGKDSDGGNAMVGWLETMDGTVSEKIVRGVEGNYYVDVIDSGRFYNFLKTILGYKYGEGKTYYFAAQAIAVPDTAYTDSEISAIGSVGIVQDASKPAGDYTVAVSGGKIDGVETEVTACYGVRLTLTAEKPEDKDTFVGWKDGEGTIVSHAPNFVYTVTGSVSLTAEFIDSSEDAVKLEAPDNSNDQMIAFNVIGAECQYDRQKDETGEPKTALGEGVAYVMYYVYTSNDDNAAVIASAKLYWNAEEEKGYFEAANGTRFDMLMGAPGNFWTTDGNAHNFFKYTVIGNYDSSGATKYYYACQAIADDSGNYVNSDIGPKGSGWGNI